MAAISYINYVLEPSKITVYGIKKYSIKKITKNDYFQKDCFGNRNSYSKNFPFLKQTILNIILNIFQ